MTAPRVDRAKLLAELLEGEGIRATHDVTKATGRLPCILVPPPTLTYDRPHPHASVEWRLVALADGTSQAKAWEQLDNLLVALEDALELERAEPASYVLPTGGDPVPCYVITYLESL